MDVLLVAATPFEIAPTIAWLEQDFEQSSEQGFSKGNLQLQIKVTGIGMMATTWQLGGLFALKKPDFAIHAGVGGALDARLKLGDVVQVTEETLADLGAEDRQGQLLDLFDLGFVQGNDFPFTDKRLQNAQPGQPHFLPAVKGVTVNKAHGSQASIELFKEKFPHAQVESMEGAAFFYACLQSGLNFLAIRSISNYVEPRNRETWELPLAINNLNHVLMEMLKTLI